MKKMYEESNIKDIADAIREKNGSTDTYKPSEMGNAIRGIVDYFRLVSACVIKGLGVFDTEEVVLNLDNVSSLDRFLYAEWGKEEYPNEKVKYLVINCKLPITDARQMICHPNGYSYQYDTKMERITLNADFKNSTRMLEIIVNCKALKVIDGTPIDFSSSTNNGDILKNCDNVEEIRIAPNSIKVNTQVAYAKLLSNESIQSIIDGLADLTGNAQQTFTWHTDVFLKLTDEQLLTITNKNWAVR